MPSPLPRARASTPPAEPARSGPASPEPAEHERRGPLLRSLRRTALAFLLLLVVEYLVVPSLIGATHDLHVLTRLQPAWLAVGVTAEAACLVSYAMLVRALLPPRALAFGRLLRIVLATTAVAHVTPTGDVGSVGVGYYLLVRSGVEPPAAAFGLGTAALGSAMVLNVLLWLSLLVSIPIAGFHPIYVTTALVGLLAISGGLALLWAFTAGERGAVRVVRTVGRVIPRVGPDRAERVVHDLARSLQHLTRDRRLLVRASSWAAANWLLDAAALWCFLAALQHYTDPFELLASYGIANILAVIPLTPAGLGVIDATTPALLVSFGVTRSVAAFAVLAWRLVNYWLPIPVGALAYLSLRPPQGERRPGGRGVTGRCSDGTRRWRGNEERIQMVHPALHNANLSACVVGEVIVLPAGHAKLRRDGYRKERLAE